MTTKSILQAMLNGVTLGKLDYADYALARLAADKIPASSESDLWLLVLVNTQLSAGHVCLEVAAISALANQLGWANYAKIFDPAMLAQSPLIGLPGQNKLLIFDESRLYLQRYHRYEVELADEMLTLTGYHQKLSAEAAQQMAQLFDPANQGKNQSIDWQKQAALVSCERKLSLISGGPGTGKTWTVCKILAALLFVDPTLKISLAAPTGKAAARLNESISQLLGRLPIDEKIKQLIPQKAQTLHRLLGINRFSHQPRYHRQNSLGCDVLIVDEASMIDLQTMFQITQALGDRAKLILLGDKDQLASVEAGSVFADLCAEPNLQNERNNEVNDALKNQVPQQLGLDWLEASVQPQWNNGLASNITVLKQSFRFQGDSAIALAAKAVNNADEPGLIAALENDKDISWQQGSVQKFHQHLLAQAKTYYQPLLLADSIEQAFEIFYRFQILVAAKRGDYGVESINQQIDQYFHRLGLISQTDFYPGKPLMMRRNDYFNDVYNGDIGIIWPDQNGQLQCWFQLSEGGFKTLSLAQIHESQSAYAMTVHKSQGSEFETVWLVLPQHESTVCSREWFYTGITRAIKSFHIWGQQSVLVAALKLKTRRASGLVDRLLHK